MPTVLLVQGWRLFFYSNEGNEPIHVHAVKGDAECKCWLDTGRFDIEEDFEFNVTPRLRRQVRQIIFEHFDEIVSAWRKNTRDVKMRSRTKPVLAKEIRTSPEALALVLEDGTVSVPWERCSERLAHASLVERTRAVLSPSGYGIHWPLIDEDLAIGPLVAGQRR